MSNCMSVVTDGSGVKSSGMEALGGCPLGTIACNTNRPVIHGGDENTDGLSDHTLGGPANPEHMVGNMPSVGPGPGGP